MTAAGEASDGATSAMMFSGQCPDKQCQATLFFPSHDALIECSSCGQRHAKDQIENICEVTNPEVVLHNVLKNYLLGHKKPKKCSETVKVLGVSNFQCKLLSPFLTTHGMDKSTGQARPLAELGQTEPFDCGLLGDRAFLIEPSDVEKEGYGRDASAAVYLEATLRAIRDAQPDTGSANISGSIDERLVPVHADGDGSCLVHAVSRALVGRELFSHALRVGLQSHLQKNLDDYSALFADFVDKDEWGEIIAECDPSYLPRDGEQMGLRNMHIFGLANVLRRPIILLDSISGIQSSGDYTGVFLPELVAPSQCRGKDGSLNKPLCIAWSSNSRNHYIALVPLKSRPLPKLPPWLTPQVWGAPQHPITDYIELDHEGAITLCGDKCLQDKYILRLVSAMESLFETTHGVSTSLLADVHQYIYKSTGMVGVAPETVIAQTCRALDEHVLYRCLTCEALSDLQVPSEWLRRGGTLYKLATDSHGKLSANKHYSFPTEGLVCSYDAEQDALVPKMECSRLPLCQFCQGTTLRKVKSDGSPVYENGDRTNVRAPTSRCLCGYKHYWEGQLYDNKPEEIAIPLEWGGKRVSEAVAWFQYESDPALNSNVYQVAQQLVTKHFPGAFGSERLVQQVVDTILVFTAQKPGTGQEPTGTAPSTGAAGPSCTPGLSVDSTEPCPDHTIPTKIILSGQQRQAVHKEELNMSATERNVRDQIRNNAPQQQKRKTDEQIRVVTHSTTSTSSMPSSSAAKPQTQPDSGVAQSAKHFKPIDTSVTLTTAVTTTPSTQPVTDTNTETSTEQHMTSNSQSSHIATADDTKPKTNDLKDKKVKAMTNDGRQLMLSLPANVTHSTLMLRLEHELSVPATRLRVKHGFPPRELTAPPPLLSQQGGGQEDTGGEGAEEPVLPIRNNDKLTVDILPDPAAAAAPVVRKPVAVWPAQAPSSSSSWSHFDPDARSATAQSMLTSLDQLQDSKSGAVDTAIAALALMAALQNKDLWSVVQTMPHLFSVGGLFYEQVHKDIGLTDGKHYNLPSLPGKVFRYSSQNDRLELCLEPHGHFAIAPGIEAQVLHDSLINMAYRSGQMSASASYSGTSGPSIPRELGMGALGVTVGKAEKTVGKVEAFQGAGQSLRSAPAGSMDSRMPSDLSPTASRHRQRASATRFRKISTSSREESIEEMDESEPQVEGSNPADTAMESRTDGVEQASRRLSDHNAPSSLTRNERATDEDRALVSQMIALTNSLSEANSVFSGAADASTHLRTDFKHDTKIDCGDTGPQVSKQEAGSVRKLGPGYTVMAPPSGGTGGGENGADSGGGGGTVSEQFHNLTCGLEALVEDGEEDPAMQGNVLEEGGAMEEG